MRWLSYFILAYVTLALQAGIARAMQWNSVAPNFVLLAVVFIALNAPREVALLGCFLLGFMQDLTSQGTMGLFAFCYGLLAMLIFAVRQGVYRRHPLSHFVLALIGGVTTAIIIAIHGWLRPPMSPAAESGQKLATLRPAVLPLFYTAIYSAILAPLVIGGLQRLDGLFHFQSTRRRIMATRPR
jgi:rod shape-determining protein MreD